jgi:uncharacterized Rmd1/YagE family protein
MADLMMDRRAPELNNELLIRVDSDVRHLNNTLSDMRDRQTLHEKNTAALTESLTKLTYNVGAIVEALKDTKEGMQTVMQHGHRIYIIEEKMSGVETEIKELKTGVNELTDTSSKGQFLWKIIWGIITTPIALGLVYMVFDKLHTLK